MSPIPPPAEPPMKHFTWPQVALILGITCMVLTAVVILAALDKDVGAILGAVGIAMGVLFAALGINTANKVDQVKELTNGRISEILNMVKDLQDSNTAIALQVPPPPPTSTPPAASGQ